MKILGNWGVFVALVLTFGSCSNPATSGTADSRALIGSQTITVNSGTSTGSIKYGGIGFLYGLSENSVTPDSTITGLGHPQYTGQKAPWGAQHPDGDALNVAVQAKRLGMKGVSIYVQDYYAAWPYPNNGVNSYISNVVDKVIASVVADPNRKFVQYVPFNEPDWIWYANSGSKFTQFLSDWKAVYNEIKSKDPGSVIIGPNYEHYNATAYDAFFSYAKANNCLPDITSWHQLDSDWAAQYYNNYNNYRSIESKYGISAREIFINEYGQSKGEMGRPGKMVQFLTRFEKTKVYGGMASWDNIGTLDDLLTNSHQIGGAWYLYQWYGQATGNSVSVSLPSDTGPLQAMGFKSATNTVKVIFGGSANDSDTYPAKVVVTGLSGSSVHYAVKETNYSGNGNLVNAQGSPATIASGSATVSGGSATITVSNCKALSAYLLDITP